MEDNHPPDSYLIADRAPFERAATGPLESSRGRQGPSQSRFEGDAASPEDPGDSRGQLHPPYVGRGHLPYAARVQRGHRHGYRLPRRDPVPEPRQEQLADPPAKARLRPPRGQHLAGVLARLAAHLDAAEHPGELLDAIFGRELRDRGARGAAVGELRDPQVMMRLTRDLRQVRHAEYLSTPAEGAQLPAHDLGDRAADAGVHLVEYNAARRLRRARYLHRERQPRELASRGDL